MTSPLTEGQRTQGWRIATRYDPGTTAEFQIGRSGRNGKRTQNGLLIYPPRTGSLISAIFRSSWSQT